MPKYIILSDDTAWLVMRGSVKDIKEVVEPQPGPGNKISAYTTDSSDEVEYVLSGEDGDPIDEVCPQPKHKKGDVLQVLIPQLNTLINSGLYKEVVNVQPEYVAHVEVWIWKYTLRSIG